MPESRTRKKKGFTPPPEAPKPVKYGNAAWWAPVMIAFFLIGLLWLVVYYIAGADLPLMKSLGWLNVLVGFGFIGIGFGMATRWR